MQSKNNNIKKKETFGKMEEIKLTSETIDDYFSHI
jgi:hypothetical protein